MTRPDLTTCPSCGRRDFPLSALERVEAIATINLAGDRATGFTAHWDGETRVLWDSSKTCAYLCGACGATLPEEYAALLDRLLENTRASEPER